MKLPSNIEEYKKLGKRNISKDDIAKLLATSKEALAMFEESYKTNVLDTNISSGNFYEVNSRQAALMHESVKTSENDELENIKKRILNELLAKANIWQFDGQEITTKLGENEEVDKPVTSEEIKALPEELRPQLTGNLMQVDINEPAFITILDLYNRFLKEDNPKKKQMYYHLFRQGLDILDIDDITRQIIATNKNSMGYWLPDIVKAVLNTKTFKVPATTIVKVPTTMLQLTRLDYTTLTRPTLDIVNAFCYQAFNLDETKEYFIKTGTYSSKFDFRNAYVHEAKEVREIGEYLLFIHHQALQMANFLTKPIIYGVSTTDEWVVREYIKDKEDNPCIYKGLPLHTEYRVFVDFDTKEIIGMTPYWEESTMKKRFSQENDANSPHNIHDYIIYTMHEPTLTKRYEENKTRVLEYVQTLIANTQNLTGQWSIDIMQNGNDFWLIDMALAENSAFYDCVPTRLRRKTKENWLPQIN